MTANQSEYEQFLSFLFDNHESVYGDAPLESIVNFNELSQSQFISFDLVEPYLDLPWNYDFLSQNYNITFDIIQSHPELPWNADYYSLNPNITIDIVLANPDIAWNWDSLTQNPSMTWSVISANKSLPWNWSILTTVLVPSIYNLFFVPEKGDRIKFFPNKHVEFSSTGNILNCNNIITASISINTSSNDYPLETDSVTENLSFTYGPSDTLTFPSGNTLVASRNNGRLISNGEISVDSDERNVTNIESLPLDYCTNFITSTSPKKFNWSNGDDTISYGFVGQDLLKLGYTELITPVTNTQMNDYTDGESFNSPANVQYTVCYNKLIPILCVNQKDNISEIDTLRSRVTMLESTIADLMSRLVALENPSN